jgi:hypothetical protein
MKRTSFLIVLFLVLLKLSAQLPELNIWNNLRHSSYTQEEQIYIRCETIDLPMVQTDLYYFWEGEWVVTEMENLSGLTVEGVINGSYQQEMICRFKTWADSLVGMMPAYVSEDIFPPDLTSLSIIAADGVGDTIDPGPEQLDLLGTYFGYSDTRFYLAFQNNGSGFPTDEGGWFPSEYYVYLAGLINPENVLADTAGYGFVYTQVPLFFQPGLYRYAGTEISLDNLQQIAEIETAVVDDILYLACDIATLVNDQYFGDWPSLSNALALDFFTASFSISFQDSLQLDYALVDMSVPSLQVIEQYIIEPFTNVLPVLSEISTDITGEITFLELIYQDENQNFPLIAEVITDQNETYELQPTTFDFSQPVVFEAEIPASDWDYLNIFFSDNGYEFVEEIVFNSSAGNQTIQPQLSLSIYPNPFNPEAVISFQATGGSAQEDIDLTIYNIKGQEIKKYSINTDQYSITWDGKDDSGTEVASGIYFCKLCYGKEQLTRKLLLMK